MSENNIDNDKNKLNIEPEIDEAAEKKPLIKSLGMGVMRHTARVILVCMVLSVALFSSWQVWKYRNAKKYEAEKKEFEEQIKKDPEVEEILLGSSEKDTLAGVKDLVGKSSDYSDTNNWLRIPEAKLDVDTFFVYPTIYEDASEDADEISSIDDTYMRLGAQGTYIKDAMAFEACSNVFVPFYRQSNLAALAKIKSQKELEEFHKNVQRTDIYGALDYYFEHYNQGRPFILAGHSQGSILLKIAIEEYMQIHPDYYERMIAAYLIGYSVTKKDLKKYPHMKFAKGEDDTHVIISWNTEGEGNLDKKNIVVWPGAVSINPINWKLDETYAPAEDNLGSRLDSNNNFKITKDIDWLADAKVNKKRGVVICTNKKLPRSVTSDGIPDIFGPDSLHTGDYAYYYRNVEANAIKRVDAFMEKWKDK